MSKLYVGRVFLSNTFSKQKKIWTKTFDVGRSDMDVHTYTKVYKVQNMHDVILSTFFF